jgi:hypothetical protein
MANLDYQVGMPSASDLLTSREKRVENEVRKAVESVWELREKFEGWGFSPLDPYVQDLIDESGYLVSTFHNPDGTWTAGTTPKSDRKFDPTRAQKALHEIGRADGLVYGPRPGDLRPLAGALYSAAKTSLEKHGDLRDAVKEMGDYELRDRSHPNASKRDDLRRILLLYVSAREQYKDDVDSHLGGTVYNAIWFDERIKQFQNVAAEYLDTPNAHTEWLTNQISAWLLRPYTELLRQGSTRSFLTERPGFVTDFIRGIGWKKPWCTVVPLCISALLFLLSVALVIGCYLFFTPTAAYGAAALCGLVYARRYVQARRFRKERERVTRLWHKVSELHNEVEYGKYNAGEVIRRFREIEADDVRLPSIFVSVIALPEVQPAKQGPDPA